MTKDLFRVVYCSRNLIPAQDGDLAAEVASILATARVNNARDGVTGALVYNEHSFAQVLEGQFDAVDRTFKHIQRDPRHDNVTLLRADHTNARLFGTWAMALAKPTDPVRTSLTIASALAHPTDEAGMEVVALLADTVELMNDVDDGQTEP
jgi:hypothetical protein